MLAILAGNCWIKLLLRLRVTQQFGPLFKVIQMMIIDLGIFLVLWIIIHLGNKLVKVRNPGWTELSSACPLAFFFCQAIF